MEEYFDEVDENNQLTGMKVKRSEAHVSGRWHRVVHIYLFKKEDEELYFLVHLRSKRKDLNPNRWDTRFGGHLKQGKGEGETVIGELNEELGLNIDLKDLIKGRTYKKNNFPNCEFASVFFLEFVDDLSKLTFKDGEVQEIKWMKHSDIVDSMENEKDIWAAGKNGFLEILDDLKGLLGK